MRKTYLFVAVAATAVTLTAAPAAFATPDKSSPCSGCHLPSTAVKVAATQSPCTGTNATFSVSVSDTNVGGEGFGVFRGSTKIVGGYYPATSQFTVAAGSTYTVYGVSDGANRGGSASITISPSCNTCNPLPENCTDGVDNDCDGAIDCRDSNCSTNQACVTCLPSLEICNDMQDNDCDGLVDCKDSDCSSDPSCSGGCTNPSRSERRRCADGIDNDCDGLADCQDRDCRKDAACR